MLYYKPNDSKTYFLVMVIILLSISHMDISSLIAGAQARAPEPNEIVLRDDNGVVRYKLYIQNGHLLQDFYDAKGTVRIQNNVSPSGSGSIDIGGLDNGISMKVFTSSTINKTKPSLNRPFGGTISKDTETSMISISNAETEDAIYMTSSKKNGATALFGRLDDSVALGKFPNNTAVFIGGGG